MELQPINDEDFQKKLKGCGIKYYSKIPRSELKAKLGFRSTRTYRKPVEVADENESKIFTSITQAAEYFQIPNPCAIKYALDNKKPSIKRRSDQKIFYIREIC